MATIGHMRLTLVDMDTSLKPDGYWACLRPAPVGLATNDTFRLYPKLQAWSHTPFEEPQAMADSCLGAAGIAVINYVATLAMYLPVVVL